MTSTEKRLREFAELVREFCMYDDKPIIQKSLRSSMYSDAC